MLFRSLGLLALSVLGMRRMHDRPIAAFGTVMAWTIAMPWIVIPLNLPLSEHRYYGPLLGLCIVAAPVVERLGARLSAAAARPLIAVPLLAMVLVAATRSLDFCDEVTIWARALAQNPASFRANWGYGAALQQQGRIAEAEIGRAHV